MKRLTTILSTFLMIMAMIVGSADASAQTRSTSGSNNTSRSSSSTSRSSGSSSSTSRSNGSSSTSRSSGSSSTSRSSSGSSTRTSSSQNKNSGTSVSRSTSSSTQNRNTSSTVNRSTSSSTQNKTTGSTTSRTTTGTSTSRTTSGSTTRTTGTTTSTNTGTRTAGSINTAPSRNSSATTVNKNNGVTAPAGDNGSRNATTGIRTSVRTVNRTTSGTPAQNDKIEQNNRPYQPGQSGHGSHDMRPVEHFGGNSGGYRPIMYHPTTPIPHDRIHPRDREWMLYNQMYGHHYYANCDHYFGHVVRRLPLGCTRYRIHGVTYYIYDGIYYRRHCGHYIVCRPPIGIHVSSALIADRLFRPVYVSYYNTVTTDYALKNANNSYITSQNETIAKNNEIIAQQQEIIARNNEIIAQQQDAIANGTPAAAPQTRAINKEYAKEATSLVNQLGLVQSYADAAADYYYQDGVFYKLEDGEYYVIVPPAGARVDALPDDFELVTLSDGMEYYKVDDTIYMVTIIDNKSYFEVLGQINE